MADLGNVMGASGLCPAYVEQCLTTDTNLVSAVFRGGRVAGGLEARGEGAPGHRCSRHGRARHQFSGCGVSACFLGLGCLLADPTPKAAPYWRKLGFTRGKFWAKHFARCAVSGKYIYSTSSIGPQNNCSTGGCYAACVRGEQSDTKRIENP